ncbi:MAG: MgtC/SapB family protein [Nanoarchaeota archaeon]|nr:MgtC/SapB family protein [Nanoarchaeota archaeon]
MDIWTIILRFILTFLLALFFGIQRQRSHKPVGFGTYVFVAIGSCGLAIIAVTLAPDSPFGLLASIVSGIGFLGAGALIKTTDKIFGFTSAASIWLIAILGLCIGIGEYAVGGVLYSLIFFVLVIDKEFEKRGMGSYQRKVVITTNKIIKEKDITTLLQADAKKFQLITIEISKAESSLIFTYLVEGRKNYINSIPKILFEKDWLKACKIE